MSLGSWFKRNEETWVFKRALCTALSRYNKFYIALYALLSFKDQVFVNGSWLQSWDLLYSSYRDEKLTICQRILPNESEEWGASDSMAWQSNDFMDIS